MTISLDHLPTNSDLRLRSYRDAASFLFQYEQSTGQHSPTQSCSQETPSTPCGSPPRFRPTPSRRRSRTSELSLSELSSCDLPPQCKLPRSVSPQPTSSSFVASNRRRVTWAEELITSIHTRPRTNRQDIPHLFYSKSDEKRFRLEADTENWDAPAVEPICCHDETEHKPLWSAQRERKDYAISKAIVVFGETTKTYSSGCALEASLHSFNNPSESFDDAAFWNGVLTWS